MASNQKKKIDTNSIPNSPQDRYACITETQLKNNKPFKITGFNIYKNDRNAIHSSGGVVNKNINKKI